MNGIEPSKMARWRAPLYCVIERELRGRIQNGHWSAGSVLPSRKSLASEYGVDLRTLQRAIDGLLVDGTLSACRGRGTFVREVVSERERVTGTAETTVVVIAEQSFDPGPACSVMTGALRDGLLSQERPCRILPFYAPPSQDDDAVRLLLEMLRLTRAGKPDGVIFFHSCVGMIASDTGRVLGPGVPTVVVDCWPPPMGCDFVGIQHHAAARRAVNYLMASGHERIAFVGEHSGEIGARVHGWRDAHIAVGKAPAADLMQIIAPIRSFYPEGRRRKIKRIVDHLLSLSDRPTAILAADDITAEYLIVVLEDIGVVVPDTISVIGFGDTARFRPAAPALTTVQYPYEEIGAAAAMLLRQRMAAGAGRRTDARSVVLPAPLIVRQSTRPLRPRQRHSEV